MQEHAPLKPVGYVTITVNGQQVFTGTNLVLDNFYELALRGAMNTDYVKTVQFAVSAGQPIVPAMTRLPSVVASIPVGSSGDARPLISLDASGRRTVGTWSASYAAAGALGYDTIGLVSNTGLLVAALSVGSVTLATGDIVAVTWTIGVRGSVG